MGGQGRKTIIPLFSPKRYRKRCGLALSVSSQAPRQGRVAAPSVCFAAARILLAAAPTAPPCFRHWRRSSVSKARPFASCRASGVQWKVIRPAKASPFGRGVTEGDGEGKPGRKEPLRSDGQALCQSDAIAVPELFGSALALSVSSQAPRQGRVAAPSVCFAAARILLAAAPTAPPCFRHWRRSSPLPQRGSHWHVGQLSSGRAKHNISETAVLRCLGQRQLDKERCPEAAVPASKARPLASCRASGVQWKVTRPAKASPFGRGGTEGDGEGEPGRKEPLRSDGQALCQSDAIAVPELFVSGLALSVSLRSPALPEGEPLPEKAP